MSAEQFVENAEKPKLREVGGIIEIASYPQGLPADRLTFEMSSRYLLSGDPNKTSVQREQYGLIYGTAWEWTNSIRGKAGDFNGRKVSISQVQVNPDQITINAVETDYFTLWGLPSALPTIHKMSIEQITTCHKTEFPIGISNHSMLVTNDGLAVLKISSRKAGFAAGRMSISAEEQMDPDKDMNPFNTTFRGWQEEFGVYVPEAQTRFLGIGMEKGTAYASLAFVSVVEMSEKSIRESWRNAPDFSENTDLFFVPVSELESWTGGPVKPEVWREYANKDSKVQEDAIIELHPTVQWRAELLEKHIATL